MLCCLYLSKNLAAGMNKIKEHHNLERQIED